MADIIDLFGNQEETYRASLWLYNSTEGVIALGDAHATVEAAENALATYSELTPNWNREVIYDGIDLYAGVAYDGAFNVAIIFRVENGNVVSRAPIEDGWFPPGDPRLGFNVVGIT